MIRLWRFAYLFVPFLFCAVLVSQGNNAQAQASTATVGGRVWLDSNGDGVQDPGEPGIATITVVLFDVAGTLIDIGVTDHFGNYRFNDLQPGSYYVIPDQETLPQDWVPTLPNVGDSRHGSLIHDSVTDSDLLPEQNRTVPTTFIPARGQFLSLDLGLYPLATVGSRAWHDLNGDGIQDIAEPGLPGVTVHLLGGQSGPLMTMTDENGYYHFAALQPGQYQLLFVRPTSYRFSPHNQGDDPQLDSDAQPMLDDASQAQTAFFDLLPSQNETSFDLGLYGVTAVNGLAWTDRDGDGRRSQGEAPLAGVTVELYLDDHRLITKVVTDDTGHYSFTDLRPGDYYLQFIAPDNLVCTRHPQSRDDASIISQADPESGQIMLRGLNMETAMESWSAGFTEPSTLEDRIWLDNDLNGQLDLDETGLADVLVELYDSTDQLQASTRSDSQGFFQFMGLTPGDYRLQVHHPDGYYFTQFLDNDVGIDNTEDGSAGESSSGEGSSGEGNAGVNHAVSNITSSDIDPVTGSTDIVALQPGLQSGIASAGLALDKPIHTRPTEVELIHFGAQPMIDTDDKINNTTQVSITWEAQSETESFGYRIYRSTYVDGISLSHNGRLNAALITPEMLPSQPMDGHIHEWIDSSILPNLHYRYWLVSVIDGQEESVFGPVEVHATTDSQALNPTQNITQTANLSGSKLIFLPLICSK